MRKTAPEKSPADLPQENMLTIFCMVLFCMVTSGMNLPAVFSQPVDSITTIQAFHQVTGKLASSGYVKEHEFTFISQSGFSHVISLLPGDQSREKSIVQSHGMSFTNIGVDWGNPTLKNLDAYFGDMKSHSQEKVYLHCEANMRASAFLFLYRVIQEGTDKKIARAAMDSIWYPAGHWHSFIEKALAEYGLDPEYRFEPDFVNLLREEGTGAAAKELSRILAQGEEPPFRESDLSHVAGEFESAERTDEAIQVYTMNTLAFPDSWQTHSQLGNILISSGDNAAALLSYERVIELDPDNLWAKRMLGKLGSPEHEVYWTGIAPDPEIIRALSGTYDLGNSTLEFSAGKDGFFLRPSWSKQKYEIYSDSPESYFVHENNWNFEFPAGDPGIVSFILPGRTHSGKKIK